MNKLLKITETMKWLGLIGIVGNITGNKYLTLCWLFFLLGFVEIFHKPNIYIQSLKQLISTPVIMIKHRFHLPSIKDCDNSITYGLPFEGEWLVANGGTDKESSHSWSILPQRYAYDFLIIDNKNETHKHKQLEPDNYYCYGKNVLAPADGIVIKLKNKYPNSQIFANNSVDCKARDIRGNYITMKHGKNQYTTIAHIKPGSIIVKKGQKVVRGQIIAQCGNTGNSSEPHIHFQLNTGKSFFCSAGLPILFGDITVREIEFDNQGTNNVEDNDSSIVTENELFIHKGQLVRNT